MLKEAIMKNTFSIDFWFWALWNNLISLRCTIDITNLLIWMPNDAQCHFWALLGILRARHSILRCSVWAFFWNILGISKGGSQIFYKLNESSAPARISICSHAIQNQKKTQTRAYIQCISQVKSTYRTFQWFLFMKRAESIKVETMEQQLQYK